MQVYIAPDPANTGILYVGNSDVTANTAAATDGFPLTANSPWIYLTVSDPTLIYVIASAASQKVFGLVNNI